MLLDAKFADLGKSFSDLIHSITPDLDPVDFPVWHTWRNSEVAQIRLHQRPSRWRLLIGELLGPDEPTAFTAT